jgi:hypothetical protein
MILEQKDTGERKEFFPDSYMNDTTTMHSSTRKSVTFNFCRASDGYRVDDQPDGTFQDKWGTVWIPA